MEAVLTPLIRHSGWMKIESSLDSYCSRIRTRRDEGYMVNYSSLPEGVPEGEAQGNCCIVVQGRVIHEELILSIPLPQKAISHTP